jgi:phosphoribosyl 1,2-cyclic phosphodiesterase
MKTPEEYAKMFWYGEMTDLDMIEEIQKEAYNQAIEDAIEELEFYQIKLKQMKLKVIASGSKGNCYLLENNDSCLILEAGIKLMEIKKAIDFKTTKISGCLVSHEHQDHAKYIKEYLEAGITVNVPVSIFVSKFNFFGCGNLKIISGETVIHGKFKIMPFRLIHDVECFGFLIFHPDFGRLLFCTDTKYIPYRFTNLQHIVCEVNYDDERLEDNVVSGKINKTVRDRVINSHMGLETFVDYLSKIETDNLKTITLCHLSDGNSDADKFIHEITGKTGVKVIIADKGTEVELNLF